MTAQAISGRQFFKLMLRHGVPASVLAFKAKIPLAKIYRLKTLDQVPAKYIDLMQHCAQGI